MNFIIVYSIVERVEMMVLFFGNNKCAVIFSPRYLEKYLSKYLGFFDTG